MTEKTAENKNIFFNFRLSLSIQILFFFLFLNNANSQSDFFVASDYASFYQDNNNVVLEIYISFYQRYFKYIQKNDKFEASAVIDVIIADKSTNAVVSDNSYQFPIIVNDTLAKNLINSEITQINYKLPSGKNYYLKVVAYDANFKSHRDSSLTEMNIPPYLISNVQISDIELITSVEKLQDQNSRFAKYGMEVIPSVSNVFGNNINSLLYYTEIYGLNSNQANGPYRLKRAIQNLKDSSIYTSIKEVFSEKDITFDIWKLKVDSLETGQYLVKLSVLNSSDSVIYVSDKKFYIYNSQKNISGTNVDIDEQMYLKSEYANMNEDQIQKEYDYSVYIRNSVETKEYENLKTIESRRRYMYTFWKKRDITPSTPVNEVKNYYMQRIKYANDNFKESFREGWKTDRGRILVLYGSPNDIERHEFESDTRSYQIWRYEQIDGGSIAVFGEMQYDGSGLYSLVHSTIRGEFQDQNWLARLKK